MGRRCSFTPSGGAGFPDPTFMYESKGACRSSGLIRGDFALEDCAQRLPPCRQGMPRESNRNQCPVAAMRGGGLLFAVRVGAFTPESWLRHPCRGSTVALQIFVACGRSGSLLSCLKDEDRTSDPLSCMKARGGTDRCELRKIIRARSLLSVCNASFINFWLLCVKMPITVRGKIKFCLHVIFNLRYIFWGSVCRQRS